MNYFALWCLLLVSSTLALPYIPGAPANRSYSQALWKYSKSVPIHQRFIDKLPVFARCPNGTEYLISRERSYFQNIDSLTSASGFPPSESIYEYKIHGCCQSNSTGCFDEKKQVLYGCCPDNSTCCVSSKTFLGCAHSLNQCCNDRICPDGYGCCGGVPASFYDQVASGTATKCCPLPPGADINDKSTYCQAAVIGDVSLANSTKAWTGCLVSYTETLDFCDYRGSYSVLSGNNTVDWMDFIDAGLVTEPCFVDGINTPVCRNLTNKCQDTSECAYFNHVSLGTDINPYYDEAAVVEYEQVGGCCPVGTDACVDVGAPSFFGGNEQDIVRGCADPALGETCCGPYVCPIGTRCCSGNETRERLDSTQEQLDLGIATQANYTVYYGCCPTELECCNRVERDPENAQFGLRFFCGAPFKNESCARNMHVDPFWFQHIRYQLNGDSYNFNEGL